MAGEVWERLATTSRVSCRLIADKAAEVGHAQGWRPTEGSQVEVAAKPPNPGTTIALVRLLAAIDGLRGLAAVLGADPPLWWAHHVQARSVLLPSSRAYWLLDPGVSVKERVARGFEEQRNAIQESERLPFSGGFDGKYAALVRRAGAWGLQPRYKNGKLTKIEGANLVKDGEAAERLLEDVDEAGEEAGHLAETGGMSTGQLVHLLVTGSVHADPDRLLGSVEGGDGEPITDVRPSPRFAALFVGVALLGFDAAYSRLVGAMGWGDVWDAWSREAYRRVYLINGIGFGRRHLTADGIIVDG